ncbi:MAG: hypothetical protein QM479_02930 [Pseudomonadota bacterium]
MKIILLTISMTIVVIALSASVLHHSILGIFGLTIEHIDMMQNLKASQQIVKEMKKRHQTKKINVSKKFVKKASKRVSSSALAAATIGTVAVAITVTSIEIIDYCGEKQELQKEANILYKTNTEFNFKQCLEEGKDDSKHTLDEVMKNSAFLFTNVLNSSSNYSSEKWNTIKEASIKIYGSTNEEVIDLWEATKSWLRDQIHPTSSTQKN